VCSKVKDDWLVYSSDAERLREFQAEFAQLLQSSRHAKSSFKKEECLICYEESEKMVRFGCGCHFDSDCLAEYVFITLDN
jgi:hypothetical protein